ncbi:hypothetical protein DFH06DRAFT_1468140 [Mycena polygramma]|nr:hypothetical protein DFH06DRAFT_1468140 [Mycena polygramma]
MNHTQLLAAMSHNFPTSLSATAQMAVLKVIRSRTFATKAWPMTPLPPGYWAQEDNRTLGRQEALGEHGTKVLRQYFFDDVIGATLASENEREILADVLTSSDTLDALLLVLGHSAQCLNCPIHPTPAAIQDTRRYFRIYIGALALLTGDHKVGYFRIKPWLDRHFRLLADLIVKTIRPRAQEQEKRRQQDPTEEDWTRKQKKQRNAEEKPPLTDRTNLRLPSLPSSTTVDPTIASSSSRRTASGPHSPSVSLSPKSCMERRRSRGKKVREAKARRGDALRPSSAPPPVRIATAETKAEEASDSNVKDATASRGAIIGPSSSPSKLAGPSTQFKLQMPARHSTTASSPSPSTSLKTGPPNVAKIYTPAAPSDEVLAARSVE